MMLSNTIQHSLEPPVPHRYCISIILSKTALKRPVGLSTGFSRSLLSQVFKPVSKQSICAYLLLFLRLSCKGR